MILALDTATTTGWAAGRPGERPIWGARRFPGGSTGEMLTIFRAWLESRCDELRPALIAFESPYIPRPSARFRGAPPLNPLTLRRLLAIVGMVEAVAWQRQIDCIERNPSEIAKFFLGNSRQGGRDAKKAATIKMCAIYGWQTVSDDAADALALWTMAEALTAPQLAARRGAGPLFIPTKENAPGASRGARSVKENPAPCQGQARSII
jgi:hypothetical protein